MTKRSNDGTLLFSVLYPGLSDAIVVDYVRSIVGQTDGDFDWLMINDNCGAEQMGLFPAHVRWISVSDPLSFGQIREMGMSYAVDNGYGNIVFSDIDDYYSNDRVALSKSHLRDYDFVFTELQIVDMAKQPIYENFISRLAVSASPTGIEAILEQNYIGLSHSAVRADAVRGLEVPSTIEVVDWWVFSLLLIQQRRGRFIPEASTYYRQSDNNYVGIRNRLDRERLDRGVSVKLNHYRNLLEFCNSRKLSEVGKVIARKYDEMTALKQKIADDAFAEEYIAAVNSNFNRLYKGWWSEIVSLETWESL